MSTNLYEVVVINIRKVRDSLSCVADQLEKPNSNITNCKNFLQSKVSKDMITDSKNAIRNCNLEYNMISEITEWFNKVERCCQDDSFVSADNRPFISAMRNLANNKRVSEIEKYLEKINEQLEKSINSETENKRIIGFKLKDNDAR